MKIVTAIVALILLLLQTGCLPILIHAGIESESQQKAAYSAYLDSMRQINTQREIAKLPLEKVMTRDEWNKTLVTKSQPSTPSASFKR